MIHNEVETPYSVEIIEKIVDFTLDIKKNRIILINTRWRLAPCSWTLEFIVDTAVEF